METRSDIRTMDVGTYTQVIHEELPTLNEQQTSTGNTVRLRLIKKQKSNRRVSWTSDTVDNELLNKKKSKCCCIYQKTRSFDESSSEDENADKDCEHCKGHRKTDYNHLREKNADTVNLNPDVVSNENQNNNDKSNKT